MYFLVAGLVLFFATHFYSAFRARDPIRDLRAKLGPMRFMAIYSLFAAIGFGLLVWGFDLSRPSVRLFTPPDWGRHITMALMLPAIILIVVAYAPRGYIKTTVRHPLLLSVTIWSFAHLFANGELNSVLLFGSFLIFALIDRIAVSGRPVKVPVRPPSLFADIYGVVAGSVLYFLFYKYLHALIIGVPVS